MNKYEVVATRWNSERQESEKVVVGRFDKCIHARLFADAYEMHYKSRVEIVQYVRK